MKFSKKIGFSLIEVMIVISMIGILSSIVLVNMNGAKTKTRDNAFYTQIASTQGIAYKCLTSGISDVALTNTTYPDEGVLICTASSFTATWPSPIAGSGWTYDAAGAAGFKWCHLANPSANGNYVNGSRGGNRANGDFCYKFINTEDSDKKITCTQNGCAKEGF